MFLGFVLALLCATEAQSMLVGVNFAPFTEEEWNMMNWTPLWRIEQDQVADVSARGKMTLLLARAQDDSSIDALIPFLNHSWGIELGNEPDINHHDPTAMNSWYQRMYNKIRSTGYTGNIVTGGVSSLSKNARKWLAKSLVGLPQDMVVGWHGYDNAISNLNYLPGLVGGRRHAMTEFGIENPNVGVEQQNAAACLQNFQAFQQSGALISIWYQMHDGAPGTKQNDFGIHAWDGHWRPVLKVLQTLANNTK